MTNPMTLSGKTVLVTGASSGIGLSVCQTLANQGARLLLVARDLQRLEVARDSLAPGEHQIMPIDLADTDAIAPKMRDQAEKHGPLDGLVHCAGLMVMRPLMLLNGSDWEGVMRINVTAASALAKGFRQKGVNSGGGSIVFLASVTGLVGQPAQSLYGASKGALIAMVRALAIELAREKIRINCVAPAVVKTGMSDRLKLGMTTEQWERLSALHPLGLCQAEDVAFAVAFLLAETGRWITGTTLVVDGGFTAQ